MRLLMASAARLGELGEVLGVRLMAGRAVLRPTHGAMRHRDVGMAFRARGLLCSSYIVRLVAALAIPMRADLVLREDPSLRMAARTGKGRIP